MGGCKKGDVLLVMPNRTEVKVDQLWSDDIEVTGVTSGENIKAKVKGVEETDVSPGFVLCCPTNPIKTGRVFDAQVVMLDLKSIICAGYSCILHLHADFQGSPAVGTFYVTRRRNNHRDRKNSQSCGVKVIKKITYEFSSLKNPGDYGVNSSANHCDPAMN